MALGADTPAAPLVSQPTGSGIGSVAGVAAGLFSGSSLLGGGLGLGDKSSASGAPQSATGWGTFNNPFIIGTGSAKIDSRNDQRADASLDTKQGGPSANTGAPLLTGDGITMPMLLGVGLLALFALKIIKKRAG